MRIKNLTDISFNLGLISDLIEQTIKDSGFRYGLFQRIEELGGYDNDYSKLKLNISKEAHYLKSQIKEINERIQGINKNLSNLGLPQKVSLIKFSNLENEIKKFFKINQDHDHISTKELMKHQSSNYNMFVSFKFYKTLDELIEVKQYFLNKSLEFNLDKFGDKIKLQLIEVLDLFFIGYRNTSLVILGKIFEEVITRHLFELIKRKKIHKTRVEVVNMSFESKLGFMKAERIISNKDWHVISKLKSDRNFGAHFLTLSSIRESKLNTKESFYEAEDTIKLVLKIMEKYQC